MAELPSFEEARQALLKTSVEDRVRMFNERAEAEGNPWRYVAYLPHLDFIRRMRDRTAAVKNLSGANVTSWMTPGERRIFAALFVAYFALPSIAIVTLAVVLRRWALLVGLPLAAIAVPAAGAPRSPMRYCLILATFVSLVLRGYSDTLTLVTGAPTVAALVYRWADDFGDQALIRFLVRNPEGYDELIRDGLIMVMIDSRCEE